MRKNTAHEPRHIFRCSRRCGCVERSLRHDCKDGNVAATARDGCGGNQVANKVFEALHSIRTYRSLCMLANALPQQKTEVFPTRPPRPPKKSRRRCCARSGSAMLAHGRDHDQVMSHFQTKWHIICSLISITEESIFILSQPRCPSRRRHQARERLPAPYPSTKNTGSQHSPKAK